MATSNSSDFNQTRNEIISDALITLGVYRPGATIATADYNICSNWLNKIVKALDAKGIHMWTQIEGTLFLREGVNKYTIAGASSDKAGDNVVETTISSSSSGTSLTVDSTTGMTAADNIGIELDDGTRQWTTIVSVDSSTTLTLAASLTDTASESNTVFSYTTACGKPLHISSLRFRNEDGTDRIVLMQGRDEFMLIPSKDNEGKVTQACYVTNRTDGTMFVWPTPDSVADRLKFSYTRTLQDFDSSSDNPDFPVEWLETLTLLLMARVAPIYGKSSQEVFSLRQDAELSLKEMQLWDVDNGSVHVVPNYRDDE